jgi:purine-binding chemotaxis protein CheW
VTPRPAQAAAAVAGNYGGFSIGGLKLALPMSALREVVPCSTLVSLPCPAACVMGGIDLRGVLVPVVDLRVVLGLPVLPCEAPCVVLLVHGGKILGLLSDGVTGVFGCDAGELHAACVDDPTAAIFAGSIRRSDDRSLVNVLAPHALTQLPQVPMVDDPEPARQETVADDASEVLIDDHFVPVMLFHCGRVPLAIDAMAVHATLSKPVVEPSVLARGYCLGVMEHAGIKAPVVDLLGFLGLGACAAPALAQAFVVQYPSGLLTFLVDEVVDVVRTTAADVMHVPPFALPHPTLFAGALPTTALPAEVSQRAGVGVSQYLLIDGAALKACQELADLASTSSSAQTGASVDVRSFVAGAAQVTSRRAMLTYLLGGETATPMDQVKEIVPYVREIAIFETRGALLGLLSHRGRSIPVMCLSRLSGLQAPTDAAAVSVLVVEHEGVPTGFAVPALKTIEPSDWEPELPAMGLHRQDELSQALQSRQLVQVGTADTQRMLRVLDLQRVARALHLQAA